MIDSTFIGDYSPNLSVGLDFVLKEGSTPLMDLGKMPGENMLAGFLTGIRDGVGHSHNPVARLLGSAGMMLESIGKKLQEQCLPLSDMFRAAGPITKDVVDVLDAAGGVLSAVDTLLESLQSKPRQQPSFCDSPSLGFPGFQMPRDFAPGLTVPMDATTALQTLSKNFDKIAGGKKAYDEQDLRRATNDPDPQLAAAAQFMLDNKTLSDGLDIANQVNRHKHARPDGKVSKDDLRVALSSTKLTPMEKNVLEELGDDVKSLFAGGNHALSREELSRIAETGVLPDGSAATRRDRDAARRLLDDPALLDRLDVAQAASHHKALKPDGQFTREDLDDVLEQQG